MERGLRCASVAIVALAVLASCSSSDDPGAVATTTSAAEVSDPAFRARTPEDITSPPVEGKGVVVPQPAVAAPDHYVQEEFLIGGTATAFDAVETPADGHWTAAPGEEAEYRTRVIVRRPQDAEDFSGTVIVEWFNVSAIEASPDWAYLAQEIGDEGHAYVGVSAQAQGVEGGDTLLGVDVDAEAAAESGVTTNSSGLKDIDPERYGTLVHPGDAYSFDIFNQVGVAVSDAADRLLGGLGPMRVIAVGESQSAMFLSTFVNAVHPLDAVYDAFLIHSRGAGGPSLDGTYRSSRDGSEAGDLTQQAVLIRSDLDVPVMVVQAETDLTLLGYAAARQPDTDLLRTWEMAGTAHSDAHVIRAIIGGPRDPGVGSLLGCTEPINTGPHHEIVSAALHHLVAWAADGTPPPPGERIELVEGADDVTIARDEHGNALGGIRNPLVDVPVATLSGDPPEGVSLADGRGAVCALFGRTIPFDRETLVELHGTADAYVEAFRDAAEIAVDAGFLLPRDAEELIAEALDNRSLFG